MDDGEELGGHDGEVVVLLVAVGAGTEVDLGDRIVDKSVAALAVSPPDAPRLAVHTEADEVPSAQWHTFVVGLLLRGMPARGRLLVIAAVGLVAMSAAWVGPAGGGLAETVRTLLDGLTATDPKHRSVPPSTSS